MLDKPQELIYAKRVKEYLQRFLLFLRNTDAKTRFDAFLLIAILIGLVATIVVVKQRQDLRSRASQESSIEVVDENGNPINAKDENGNPVVESQKIRIKINPPTDWNSQGLVPGLVKSVYGQEEDQGSPQCLDQGTWRGGTCINANYYKSDGTFVRDGYEPGCYQCMQNDISIQQPISTSQPIQEELQQPTPAQILIQFPNPTKIQESEQIQWIRISLNKQNIESGNCTNILLPDKKGLESSDQRQHCMEFGITDPYFLQNGGIVDWWLPDYPGTYTIYTGFVSDKGNYKPGPQITVAYKLKSGTIKGTVTVIANNRPYQTIDLILFEILENNEVKALYDVKNLISLNDVYIYDDADYNYTLTDLDKPKYAIVALVTTTPKGGSTSIFFSKDYRNIYTDGFNDNEIANLNSTKNVTIVLPPVYAPGTPETEDIELLGNLTLQGIDNDRGLNNTPRRPERFLTVLIYDNKKELIAEKEGLITYDASDGSFRTTNTTIGHPLGRVVIKIRVEGYLTRTIYNRVIENETSAIHTKEPVLLAGDINRDKIIDNNDLDFVMNCHGSEVSRRLSCEVADFDDDGEISFIDLNMVLANLGKRGD